MDLKKANMDEINEIIKNRKKIIKEPK